jgi:hypothetical protein
MAILKGIFEVTAFCLSLILLVGIISYTWQTGQNLANRKQILTITCE